MAQATTSWQELANSGDDAQSDDLRPFLNLGSLTPADALELEALADGEVVEKDFSDGPSEQLEVPVEIVGVEGSALDADDEAVEEGEEYVIQTAAQTFIKPLADAYDSLQGATITVTSAGTDQYDGYEVET